MTLFSVKQLTDMGFIVVFSQHTADIYKSETQLKNHKPFITSKKKLSDKLWHLEMKKPHVYKNSIDERKPKSKGDQVCANFLDKFAPDVSADRLHQRYIHYNLPYLQKKFPHLKNTKSLCWCDACTCMRGRKPYNKKGYKNNASSYRAKLQITEAIGDHDSLRESVNAITKPNTDFLDFVYSVPRPRRPGKETIGAYSAQIEPNDEKKFFGRYFNSDTKYSNTESVRGYRHLFIVVDRDTNVTYGFLGRSKSDFVPQIKKWIVKFKNIMGFYPKWWKFDLGGEFLNNALLDRLEALGIQFVFSTKNAHNQNSYSERKIGVVWNHMLILLAFSGVPMQFWCYAAMWTIFVLNHLPHRGIGLRSPLQAAGLKSKDEFIFVWGCGVWYFDENSTSNTTKMLYGVFLGISDFKLGYDILDIASGKIIQSRNIRANESEFPFKVAQKPCFIQLDFGTFPDPTCQQSVTLPEELLRFRERVASKIIPSKEQLLMEEKNAVIENNSALSRSPSVIPQILQAPQEPEIGTVDDQKRQEHPTDEVDTEQQEHPTGEVDTENFISEQQECEPNPITTLDSHEWISPIPHHDTVWKPLSQLDINEVEDPTEPVKISVDGIDFGNDRESETEQQRRFHISLNRKNPRKSKQTTQKWKNFDHLGLDLTETYPTPKPLKPTKLSKSTKLPKEDSWEITKILKRIRRTGGNSLDDWDYKVQWKGDFEDSWIPGANLKSAPDLMREFKNTEEYRKTLARPVLSKPARSRRPKREGSSEISQHRYNLRSRGVEFANLVEKGPIGNVEEKFKHEHSDLIQENPDHEFSKEELKEYLADDSVDETLKHFKIDEVMKSRETQTGRTDTETRDSVNIRSFNLEEDPIEGKDYKFGSTPRNWKVPIPKPEYKRESEFCSDKTLEEIIKTAEHHFAMHVDLDSLDSINMKPPKTRSKMLKDPYADEYIQAELVELQGIHRHGTFEKVFCPPDRTPITCRWVYDLKRDSSGKVVKFKARLVVHGYKQQEGIDYNKTFSSTAQLRTFRFVVSIAVEHGLRMTQYDISNAFLNGKLEEEIYMEWPPGYPSESKDKVIKLVKGLYGLKQASRIWQKTLYAALEELELEPMKCESGVLKCNKKGVFCLIISWVDDLIVVTKDEEFRKKIESTLKKHFLVKCLGELEHYIGIALKKDGKGGYSLDQSAQNRRVVNQYLSDDPGTAKTPAPPDRLSKVDCPTTEEEKKQIKYPYINATGSLLYTTVCTRPDMFFAVMQLARFNSNPGHAHVKASKQALKYLNRTVDQGIHFSKSSNFDGKLEIKAFVDSDWAGCPDTRRSTMGYIILVANGPVSYKSKLMPTLALSSCEAEFQGLTEVCREVMWMCRFLDEIGLGYHTPEIYCDSSSAINWAEDPIQHQRNKHCELKYYYIRDRVSKDEVKLFKVHTTRNGADMMTKPLGKQKLDVLIPPMIGLERIRFDPVTSGNAEK